MRAIFWVSVLLLCTSASTLARIKNGYAQDLHDKLLSLDNVRRTLEIDARLSASERHALRLELRELTDYVVYHELTAIAIQQLREISPAMFNEMDNIQDHLGHDTDIHVRLIPKEKATVGLRGAGFFRAQTDDLHTNYSRYGSNTVAIDVWICDTSLYLLSHELGHAKYIIPNLAAYTAYYKRRYAGNAYHLNSVGHHPSDPSGKEANAFESAFRRHYKRHILNGASRHTIYASLKMIRKEISDLNSQETRLVMLWY
jgi:hypothetical protein